MYKHNVQSIFTLSFLFYFFTSLCNVFTQLIFLCIQDLDIRFVWQYLCNEFNNLKKLKL